jgi:RecA-family ATPase
MAKQYAGPIKIDLEPDLEVAVKFLATWFANQWHGEIEIGTMNPATGNITSFKRFNFDEIEQAAEYGIEANRVPGTSVYFRPCLINPGAPYYVTDADYLRSPGVWTDHDTEESVKHLEDVTSMCQPTMICITGRHPYKRFHTYRLLSDGVGDAEMQRNLNVAVCKNTMGDPAVINPTRLMRLPGSIAWPWKDGRVPELTEAQISTDRTHRDYNEQSIMRAFPSKESMNLVPPCERGLDPYTAFGDTAEKEPLDVEAALEGMAIGNVHDTQVRVSAALISRGVDREIIFARLIDRARQITPKPLAASFESEMTKRIDVIIDSAKAKFGVPGTPDGSYKPIVATQYSWTEPCNIPPRDWIYGRHYIRKFLSSTIAPGGVGKSSLVLVEAISIAIGRDLLDGNAPICRARVWYYNLEDPMEELQRRVQAICKHFDVSPSELGDNLFVDSGRDQELVIARIVDGGVKIIAPVRDSIEAEITKHKIDVLIIDPFVHSHAVTENSNDEIAEVAKEWAHIANRCNCSIELIHHTRKLNGQEVTAEDSRGGSALVGVARSVRALNRVTKDEAERCGLKDDYRSFFYMGSGDKQNLAPPAESNRWRRIVSVDLENETPELTSDSVGVVEAFKLPDPFEGVTVQHLQAVQQALAGGDKRCRKSHQAKDWIGRLVAEICELNAQTDRRKINSMIETWVDSKSIVEREIEDDKRQMRPAYAVGQWARND